ncbi:hypothetical protein DPX16_18938 [Anabarilius grahami]|uniref:Uncharacterized protein n=1 Tax=Anabarilius grahami TaxID=495550 RepID=A0A3N0YMJ5_ANAGA|nr:hypothetical protein DPX16_18938 [Anabarilius grahami]
MARERANFPAEMAGAKPYISEQFAIGYSVLSPSATTHLLFADPRRSLLAWKKLAALETALPPSKRPCSGPAGSPDSQRLALADFRLRAVDEPPPPAPAPVSARLLPPSGASRAFPAVYDRFQSPFLSGFHRLRAPLQDADGHGECVGCLGKPHADDAFTGGSCSHCESMSLASLRSRAAFFRSDTDRALLSPSSREPARKRQRGRPIQRPELSELTSAQCPRASPSPSREQSPVLFSRPEQRPSADASDFVSFGGSDDELPDDSVSLAASEPEHWVGESDDPAPLPLLEPIDHSAGMDAELFRVLSKGVEELDLEWAPLEEPSRSRLDEWFLPGRRQAPRQRSAPFFPEVHEELAKSWRAPYSARLHTSHRSALTSVDGSEEKGYEHLPPLDEAVAAHLCPPAAVGWKTKRSLPSKPCRTTSALAGRAYASAGQAAKPYISEQFAIGYSVLSPSATTHLLFADPRRSLLAWKKLAALETALPPSKRPCSGPAGSPDAVALRY